MNSDKSIRKSDNWYMQQALNEAKKAYLKKEVPIGAVIVKEGKIIARGHNERELKQDSTLHAEITAIKKACHKIGSWRLTDCELYVTLEPCTMCSGAIIQSRLNKLYIGTFDPKAGAAGSVLNIFNYDFNHKVEIHTGILEEECSKILKDFFKDLRAYKKITKD